MISYNQSIKILKRSKIFIGNQLIKSTKCINRVASENILSKANNPAGNNAAFDGYAIASKDTNNLNYGQMSICRFQRKLYFRPLY